MEKFLSETKCFPKSHMTQFFKLLEKFQIALPFGEDQLLVPSRWDYSRSFGCLGRVSKWRKDTQMYVLFFVAVCPNTDR